MVEEGNVDQPKFPTITWYLTYNKAAKYKWAHKSFLQRLQKDMQKCAVMPMLNIESTYKLYIYPKLFHYKGKYLSRTEHLEASNVALSFYLR